jgi:hypothetical protein
VSCLSLRIEDEEQLVAYGYIEEQLGHKKEARSKLIPKKKMLEGFLGDDFERRLQGTQNFSLSGFHWDRVHEARKVEMRGEGTSWRKLIFLFPTRGRDHLKTKLVRGSISCTGEIKKIKKEIV